MSDRKPGWDAADWVEGGGTLEQLEQIAKDAKPYEPPPQAEPEPPPPPPATKEKETPREPLLTGDQGNAFILHTIHGHELLFNVSDGLFYRWQHHRWKQDAGEQVHQCFDDVRDHWLELATEADAEAAHLEAAGGANIVEGPPPEVKARRAEAGEARREAKRLLSEQHRAQALKSYAHIYARQIITPDLDRDPELLCCRNGILDLRLGELVRDETYLISKSCNVEWIPGAGCYLWKTFLRKVFDDSEDEIESIWLGMAYCLTGHISEQKFFFLTGAGANGKSTFLHVLRRLLGEYSGSLPWKVLDYDPRVQPEYHLARAAGRRVLTVSEIPTNRKIDDALIKDLTGGEEINARHPFGRPFAYRPHCKLWLAGNEKPRVSATDHGFWRRLVLIPFSVQIPAAEQDPYMPQKLEEELPGILAELVTVWLPKWRESGLRLPASWTTAAEEYRSSEDILGQWITERCDVGPWLWSSSADLHHDFLTWLEEEEESSSGGWMIRTLKTRVAFGRQLGNRGGIRTEQRKIRGKNVRGFSGVAIKGIGT